VSGGHFWFCAHTGTIYHNQPKAPSNFHRYELSRAHLATVKAWVALAGLNDSGYLDFSASQLGALAAWDYDREPHRSPIRNREGLTWDEWYAAATCFGGDNDLLPVLKREWKAGVDPTEWAAYFSNGGSGE
jgi:hypothetical protein